MAPRNPAQFKKSLTSVSVCYSIMFAHDSDRSGHYSTDFSAPSLSAHIPAGSGRVASIDSRLIQINAGRL